MKARTTKITRANPLVLWYGIFILVLLGGAAPLRAQINHWVNPGSGKWEVATNWAFGTPPGTNDLADNIYNGGTVTIDATTSGSFSNTMTVNNVAVETLELLNLNNAGTNVPLHVLQNLDILDDAEIIATNSALRVDGLTTIGDSYTGTFELDSGWARFSDINLGYSGTASVGLLFLNGGTLTVSDNLTLAAAIGSSGDVIISGGTLVHTNGVILLGSYGDGQFDVLGGSIQTLGFQIGNGAGSSGALSVSGGDVLASQYVWIGNGVGANPCSVTVSGGALTITNATHTAYVDVAQNSSLTLNGGLLQLDDLILTNGGTFTNLSGTFELVPAFKVDNGGSVDLAGSTNNFDGGITLGSTNGGSGSLTLQNNGQVNVSSNLTVLSGSLSSTSTVTVASSTLNVSNGTIAIGPAGSGLMTISGGTVLAQKIHLGAAGAAGKVVFNSGYVRTSELLCNWWVGGGGDLDGNGGTMLLGAADHDSLFQMDAGSATNFGAVYVGYGVGLTGTYAQDGGLTVVTTNLLIGNCASNATGIATLSGDGLLCVTNAAHNAVLEVQQGSFVMTGGTLIVDILRVTNTCGGTFIHTGGTLQYGSLDLSPNQSAVGDGIPNGWKQQYGLDPFDPTVASADPDHDGANNLDEYLAGTNPTNAASVFRMISAVRTNGQDMLIDWTTVGQHSYVVQTNGDLSRGVFNDLSPVIPVGGMGEGTASYLHPGGATNPAGFYRVKLEP